MKHHEYDAIVIGSGFGGAMIAHRLSEQGLKVAIIERGDWVSRGPENWSKTGSIDLTPNYDKSVPYEVHKGGNKKQMGVYSAVGGPSLFYGGVSFRFREEDFYPPEEIVSGSNAQWPIDYNALEKYYDQAEQLLQIAGESGIDPTEPHRNFPFPFAAAPYASVSLKIKEAAQSLGLKPFHLPLAINYFNGARPVCQLCTTCDTYACAIGAKNDLETMILDAARKNRTIDIYANTIVHTLKANHGKVEGVYCIDKITNEDVRFHAAYVVVSAGALASPHLILNSELEKLNPAGHIVGRYLMRHINSIVFGVFPHVADQQNRFHKEMAIMDFYFGHKDIAYPTSKLGSLQQVPTPGKGLVEDALPKPLGKIVAQGVKYITGLLAIAEDQPQYKNHIRVDKVQISNFNLGTPIVWHEYSARDKAAVLALIKPAKDIMKKAGALFSYVHHIRTFSHSAGTIRMGDDERYSPLDKNCNFRGVENLYVVDACFMPTSSAVNPSLTIAANALRVGDHIGSLYNRKVN